MKIPRLLAGCASRLAPGIAVIALAISFGECKADYKPQEGDIVFQSLPHSPLIDMIEGATGSPFSHCGILHQTRGAWYVIEAIGPVKETALVSWVGQGRERKLTVYRLKSSYRGKIPAFVAAAQTYEGRPYDIHYDMDDAAIYCSELIYKAFRKATGEEMGHLQKLRELNWKPYQAVIKQIEAGNVPLDRVMITPRSLSEAAQVEKVFEKSR